jgi:uridine kinase
MTLVHVAGVLASIRLPRPVLVAIDGGSAVGKTTLAAEIQPLIEAGGRPVISATIDDFHRPKAERYARGRFSAEACYNDTFDYKLVRSALLAPFREGLPVVTAIFDAYHDRPLQPVPAAAPKDALLLFEGVWLMRPELEGYWDYRILVTADSDVARQRGIERDLGWGGTREDTEKLYDKRYLPADRLYNQTVHPELRAEVIIDNTEPARRTFAMRSS